MAATCELIEAPSPAVHGSATQVLERVGKRLVTIDHLVSDLVDLSAMDSGRLVLGHEDIDLVRLVRQVCEQLEPTVHGSIVLDVRGEIMVRADLARTERVIANLVWSAADRAPLEAVILRLEQRGTMGRLSTFARRASPDYPAGRPRHGLGLYVSRRVIEAQGGRVGVDTCGALAEIYVELPIHT